MQLSALKYYLKKLNVRVMRYYYFLRIIGKQLPIKIIEKNIVSTNYDYELMERCF